MIQAEDLMIGDWVKVNDVKFPYPMQVDGLEKKGGSYYALFPKWDLSVIVDKLEPISITADILEKNGFVSEDKAHYSFCGTDNILELLENETPFGIDGFDIVRTNKGVNENKQSYYIDHYFASIYSVHQLQHALRLCGIDKEIVI